MQIDYMIGFYVTPASGPQQGNESGTKNVSNSKTAFGIRYLQKVGLNTEPLLLNDVVPPCHVMVKNVGTSEVEFAATNGGTAMTSLLAGEADKYRIKSTTVHVKAITTIGEIEISAAEA